jgi:hypothetical protein
VRAIRNFEALFRQLTPLFLLGLLVVVAFERLLPGVGWLRETFGQDAILRAAVVALAAYVLLLWGESLRLHQVLTGVLQAFRSYDKERGGGGGGGGGAARDPRARLEAARLLVAALGSPDASIRETSRHNLTRLVGKDLGADPAAWSSWIDEQARAGG